MDKNGLWTTVVGSFPLANTKENVNRTIEDQINLGIDYPCYGQLESLITQFLSPLSSIISGLEEMDNKYYLGNDFKIPKKPIALKYIKNLIDFLDKHKDLKIKIKGTKGCLTGPFTLASEIILKEKLSQGIKTILFNEPRAIMTDWVVEKLSEIMKITAKAYNDMGVEIISIDEPILGLLVGKKIMFHSEDFVINVLNKVISGIKYLSSIHVCGQISPKLRDMLLETNVNILDHEFQTNEKNFEIFEKRHFEKSDKYLALGAVKTKIMPITNGNIDDYVESLPSVIKTVKKGIEIYGKENLFIKPDCGFLPLRDAFNEDFAYEIVKRKLKNMVLAVKEFR